MTVKLTVRVSDDIATKVKELHGRVNISMMVRKRLKQMIDNNELPDGDISPGDATVNISMPAEFHAKLEIYAKKNGLSVADLVRYALADVVGVKVGAKE